MADQNSFGFEVPDNKNTNPQNEEEGSYKRLLGDKEITWFWLMQHYSKANAEAYKRQKEAKKLGKTAGGSNGQNNSPKGSDDQYNFQIPFNNAQGVNGRGNEVAQSERYGNRQSSNQQNIQNGFQQNNENGFQQNGQGIFQQNGQGVFQQNGQRRMSQQLQGKDYYNEDNFGGTIVFENGGMFAEPQDGFQQSNQGVFRQNGQGGFQQNGQSFFQNNQGNFQQNNQGGLQQNGQSFFQNNQGGFQQNGQMGFQQNQPYDWNGQRNTTQENCGMSGKSYGSNSRRQYEEDEYPETCAMEDYVETSVLDQRPVIASLTRISNGTSILIRKVPFVLGRHPRNADYLFTENTNVSGVHATIGYIDDMFYIVDNESRNGVYLNGFRIPKNEKIQLTDDMEILLGDEKLVFHI